MYKVLIKHKRENFPEFFGKNRRKYKNEQEMLLNSNFVKKLTNYV